MGDSKRVRRSWRVALSSGVLLAVMASHGFAQGAGPGRPGEGGSGDAVAAAVQDMQAAAGAEVRATRSRLTGLATFVAAKGRGIPVPDRGTPQGRAEAFVDAYGPAFGLQDSRHVRAVRGPGRDGLGIDHVRLQQVVGDVPVVGAELMVHLRGPRVMSANGKALPDVEGFDTTTRVSAAQAEQIARAFCEKKLGVAHPVLSEGRLEILNEGIFDATRQPTVLAWFVVATGPGLREYVWVDARRGGIALHFSQMHKALDRRIYTANSYDGLPGSLVATEGVSPTGDADGQAAYTFAGDAYDYFLTEHGRDSYDGLGATLQSTVHYCPTVWECPYKNAYWDGAGMVYGEGFSKADDVDAHELTHAVTEASAGLYYFMQSGALNESFSDMFGESVDLWNTSRGNQARRGTDATSVRWLVGEDVPGGALRSMMNPNQFGDPGKTGDTQFFCGYQDAGGVHTNSGVPNHAFALSVDGGTYNGITVTGIGLEKAGRIQYRVLTQYLTSAADFLAYSDAVDQACRDLVGGPSGITASDCQQVRRALDAVQIAAPTLCSLPLVPETCPAGKMPTDLFLDDFESGLANWTLSRTDGNASDEWSLDTAFASSGAVALHAPDPPNTSDVRAAMSAGVVIPSGDVRLTFNHAFDLEKGYDGGVVEYSTDGGTTWLNAAAYYGDLLGNGAIPNGRILDGPLAPYAFTGYTFGYTASQLELGPLAGQEVRFRFRVAADTSVGSRGWWIDDVRLYRCEDTPTPTLGLDDVTLREGDGGSREAVFTVSLSAPLGTTVTVDYASSDLTATAGSDYASSSGTLTIAPGQRTASISVAVLGDADVEGDETFQVVLSNPVNAAIADATGIGTIVENDGVPQPPSTSAWAVAQRGMSTQNGITYGGGLYVSVGRNADVWTSEDGVTWWRRAVPSGSYPTAPELYGATYGDGQFVAVGSCCSSSDEAMILTSPDGITWTGRAAAGVTATLRAAAQGGGQYVAVGSGGALLTSPDAVNWTARASGTTQALTGVAHGGAAFVAVGVGGTILRSTDGAAWAPQTAPLADFLGVAFTGTQFVAVSAYYAFTSPDGITWTLRSGTHGSFRGVATGPGGGVIAVGGTNVETSPDGVAWTPRTLSTVGPGGSKSMLAVAYGPHGFVVTGDDGALQTSPDGVTWVNRQMAASRRFNDVAYDGTRFCAVGFNGALARSPDGAVWTNVKAVPGGSADNYPWLDAVTRGPGLFVALGSMGLLMTSPDCDAWTVRPVSLPATADVNRYFNDVAYGAGRYVVVGSKPMNEATVGMIVTSADGLQWADLPVAGLTGVTLQSVGFGAGRFVASGHDEVDGTPILLTSEDGLQWTPAPSPPVGPFHSLSGLVNAYGTFVATGDGVAWTSPDGIRWTRSDPSGLDGRDPRAFAAGGSRFLGVGTGALESLDGTSWTPQALPASNPLSSAAYSESLDRFVTVGQHVIEYTSAALPSVSVDDVSVAEDGGPARFTVSLSTASSHPVTVAYATSNGTATAPGDYAAQGGTLTFVPGETVKTFDVAVVADGATEGAETFGVTLSGVTNATLGEAAGTGTIDDAAASPELSVGDATVAEGTGGTTLATFTVTLTGEAGPAAVRYATANGTAVAPADYAAQSGTLTFAPGVTEQTVSVVVASDALDESDETFSLVLSAPSNAHLGDGTGLGTITDDDTGGRVEFTAPVYAIGESGVAATVQVKRTGSVAAGESVVYATSDATARAGSDYASKTGTLTFAAGVSVMSFTVPITADMLAEGPETFAVTLSSPGGGAALGPLSTAVVTIRDDDLGGALKLSAAAYTITEAGPVATITVVRTGGVAGGVTVDYATSDATATAGSDYTAQSGTLTFAAGVLARAFTVPITNDGAAEGPETFGVALSNPRGGGYLATPSAASVTIADNEPVVQFSMAGYTVGEATASAIITVVRTGSAAAFTVDYAAANGSATSGADYGATSGTLSFAAGVMSRTFTVPIANDTLGEVNETVLLALSNPAGAFLGPRNKAVLTIADNEPVVQLSAATYTVTEAGPAATITVVRSGSTAAFSVSYSTYNWGSAGSWSDYDQTEGVLSFAAGVMARTITVPIINDALVEGTESFGVTLSAPSGARLGPRYYAEVRITDNEPVVQFSSASYAVSEAGGSVAITAVRTGGSAAPFTVGYSTDAARAFSPADYTQSEGTLTFGPGVLSQTFTVPIVFDSVIDPDEYFLVALSSPSGATIGMRSVAKVAITEASPVVQFSSATYAASEATGLATIMATRTGTRAISVGYSTTSDGTASADRDYTPVSGTLSFPAGILSRTFAVPITNDGIPDSGETVSLTLSGSVGAAIGPRGTAVLTISDTQPVVQFSAATYTVSESMPTATITVMRTGAAPMSVDYATSDGTAIAPVDYGATSGTLSFPAGVLSRTFTVPIVGDTNGEPSETMGLRLSNPVGAAIGSRGAATLTITDNEPVVQLSATAYTVSETGPAAAITVVRTGTAPMSVQYATGDGTATAGRDYARSSGVLSFPAGVVSKTLTVPITNDTLDEANETVFVSLSNPVGASMGARSTATLTITDDDSAGIIAFGAPVFTVGEAGPEALVTLTRSGGTSGAVTVDYATSDGTATAGSDYTTSTGTVVFAAGELSRTIAIPIANDADAEASETVLLALSNPGGGAKLGAPKTATVVIVDDE